METFDSAYQAMDFERCRKDAHHFIFNRLRTKDEHDLLAPTKPFPDEPYLRAIIDMYLVSSKILSPHEATHALEAGADPKWLEHIHRAGILFIEKSRHVMVTWITCAYILWRARHAPHQLLMVQSKREEDVAALVYDKDPTTARISFLEYTLPDHLRMADFPGAGKYCHLYFPNGSHIWGIPQGGHIIRSHNPSLVFSDESAFQPEFNDAYTAALPAITNGGQLICVSSAEVSKFCDLCETEGQRSDISV